MSRESLVFILGLLVFLTPFLGVPNDWKEYAVIGSGVLLMFAGYSLRRSSYLRRLDTGRGERRADSFVESTTKATMVGEKTTKDPVLPADANRPSV